MALTRREALALGVASPLMVVACQGTGEPIMQDLDEAQLEPRRVTATTGNGTRIHAIQTGWVAVKSAHRRLQGPAALRIPTIMMDGTWTELLPIHAWVIEHPDGVIVVDAGETARTGDPNYFACDSLTKFFYTRNLRFVVRPEDEIGPQLRKLGIEPQDVRKLVLTHLHSDHMGGLPWFPKAEIIVPREDYPTSQGTLPCRYPEWFNPRFPDFVKAEDKALKSIADLTPDGDVIIVPTPGHSNGHQSVLLQEEDRVYWFAGDASFNEDQLIRQEVAGICSDIGDARDTLKRIKTFCAQRPTVYLPTHDPASPDRLQKRQATRIP